MHLKNSLLLLLFASAAQKCAAQTPTVAASTNYVACGGSLRVCGAGFMAFDRVNVFVDDYRSPKFTCCADANGAFDMDATYGGPYRVPDLQYRFSSSSAAEPSLTVRYQAGETAWNAYGATLEIESEGMIGDVPVKAVRVTSLVAYGGHTYQFQMKTNMNDGSEPWVFVGRSWVNDTWSDTAFASEFTITNYPCAFFRVADPTAYRQGN